MIMPPVGVTADRKKFPAIGSRNIPERAQKMMVGIVQRTARQISAATFSRAMNLVQIIKDKPLNTHVEPATSIFPAMKKRFWASFSSVPYESRTQYNCNVWVSAETLSLAICYAALICKSAH